ncbi:MAG: RluA family pseudouridine synthase [Acidimicrobiales bacterium]
MSDDIDTVSSFDVGDALVDERVDRAVSTVFGLARSEVARLITEGGVLINRHPVRSKSRRLSLGEVVSVDLASVRQVDEEVAPDEHVPLDIVYQDSDLIVVDKRAGQVVHPGSGIQQGTMAAGLLARFPQVGELGEPQRPGVVHRLDVGTSGLMLFALSHAAFEGLGRMLRAHEITREYLALVDGHFDHERGRIEAPIMRSQRDPRKMEVRSGGREAATNFEVLEMFSSPRPSSLIRARLETGRTHQIRVHFAYLGHGVIGDELYGVPLDGLNRPFLHSAHLEFVHPVSGASLTFDAPLPRGLDAHLANLRRAGSVVVGRSR